MRVRLRLPDSSQFSNPYDYEESVNKAWEEYEWAMNNYEEDED